MQRPAFSDVIDRLERHHGRPKPPKPSDPFEQILYENASYLVDDERRARVFAQLAERIGTTPQAILAARRADLIATIADGGMRAPMRADKLIAAARIAQALDAPLEKIVARPFAEAKKVLARFPGVGEPGAQKIALFAGAHALLGLESNGLRVLTRLGVAPEHKSYARTFRAVSDAVAGELPADVKRVQRAHQLLRRHGQEVCTRTRPACDGCPLADGCPAA